MPEPNPSKRPTILSIDLTRDPAYMTPDQRRQELAAILARGVLRLRQNARNETGSSPERTSENTSESRGEALDEGAKTSLHVTA